ncbi:MAG: RNA polymerase sigma factor [Acidimicrobiales bacterium]
MGRADRTDTELVAAVQGGEPDAFGILFDRWFDRSWNVARTVLRDDDLAADVAQDSLLAAWQRIDQLRDPGAFGGWVLRITRNRALNRLGRERRTSSSGDEVVSSMRDGGRPDPVGAGPQPGPVAAGEVRDRQEMVWAAAAGLGPGDASLLDLQLRHGLDPAEIAQALGVPANTAHQRLFRLRARLGDVIGSFLLWRNGRPLCDGLAAAIDGGQPFDVSVARSVARHQEDCRYCSDQRASMVDPATLFAAVPILVAPPHLKAGAAAGLKAAGVAMGDVAAATGAAGPGSEIAGSEAAARDLGSGTAGPDAPPKGPELGTTGPKAGSKGPGSGIAGPEAALSGLGSGPAGPQAGAKGRGIQRAALNRKVLVGALAAVVIAVAVSTFVFRPRAAGELRAISRLPAGAGSTERAAAPATSGPAAAPDPGGDPAVLPPAPSSPGPSSPGPSSPAPSSPGPSSPGPSSPAPSSPAPSSPLTGLVDRATGTTTTAPTRATETTTDPPTRATGSTTAVVPTDESTTTGRDPGSVAASPQILRFVVTGGEPCVGAAGVTAVARWSTQDTDGVELQLPGGAVRAGPANGSESFCADPGDIVTITATGPGGSARASASVP